jgi:hypothetical protein
MSDHVARFTGCIRVRIKWTRKTCVGLWDLFRASKANMSFQNKIAPNPLLYEHMLVVESLILRYRYTNGQQSSLPLQ